MGLFIGNGRQHLDKLHAGGTCQPRCGSRQFYMGSSVATHTASFTAGLSCTKCAENDAKQTNRNLLLSDDAQIDTKPQLEIYATT